MAAPAGRRGVPRAQPDPGARPLNLPAPHSLNIWQQVAIGLLTDNVKKRIMRLPSLRRVSERFSAVRPQSRPALRRLFRSRSGCHRCNESVSEYYFHFEVSEVRGVDV